LARRGGYSITLACRSEVRAQDTFHPTEYRDSTKNSKLSSVALKEENLNNLRKFSDECIRVHLDKEISFISVI